MTSNHWISLSLGFPSDFDRNVSFGTPEKNNTLAFTFASHVNAFRYEDIGFKGNYGPFYGKILSITYFSFHGRG